MHGRRFDYPDSGYDLMRKDGDGREKETNPGTFLFCFLCGVFFWYSCTVVFPVSAVLNGTETLITTDIYKTLTYPPAIYGDRIAWATQDIVDDPASGFRADTS